MSRIDGRRPWWFVFCSLLMIVPGLDSAALAEETTTAPSRDGAWQQQESFWYTLDIAGDTAGWMHLIVESDGERYRTSSEMEMAIGRGGMEIEIAMNSAFLETHAGDPIKLHFVQDMAMQSVDTEWIFHDDTVEVITRQGGREIRNERPLPDEPWLTPMAVHRHWMERLAEGAKKISYRTITGETGLNPVLITHTRQGSETIEEDGKSVDVTVWETRNSAMPGLTSISKYDAEGRMIYEEAAMPFGKIVTRLTSRAEAIAAAGGPAPEMMVNLFVEPSRPIERPRETTRATMRIRVKEGDLPEVPSAGAQRVERHADGKAATLKVNIHDNVEATAAEKNDKTYLEPSAMADGSDELIRKMTKRAAADAGDDPMKRAEAMRAYVFEHISSKALDTAFATASEVARMKRGDCSEHGVLLCAMLRADGIPARVATGLVYADAFAGARDIFGWHMWTQALIDGRWVDFDATLPRRYDAAHVLFGTSSLDDAGSMNKDLASIITLMGNLEIEIVDVGHETK